MPTLVTISADCGDDGEIVVTGIDTRGQVWAKNELAVIPNGHERVFKVNDLRSLGIRQRRKGVPDQPRARRVRTQ